MYENHHFPSTLSTLWSHLLFPASLRSMQCCFLVAWTCISFLTGIASMTEHLVLYLLVITVSSSVSYLCPPPFSLLLGCLPWTLPRDDVHIFLIVVLCGKKSFLISFFSLWLVFVLYLWTYLCYRSFNFKLIKFVNLLLLMLSTKSFLSCFKKNIFIVYSYSFS